MLSIQKPFSAIVPVRSNKFRSCCTVKGRTRFVIYRTLEGRRRGGDGERASFRASSVSKRIFLWLPPIKNKKINNDIKQMIYTYSKIKTHIP